MSSKSGMTGNCFRLARRGLNLTQEDVAAMLGLSVRTVRNYEKSDDVPMVACVAIRGISQKWSMAVEAA